MIKSIPPIDLKTLSAPQAAKHLFVTICKMAELCGQNPITEVGLYSPGENKERGINADWLIIWEAGPYNWVYELCEGSSIFKNDKDLLPVDEYINSDPEVLSNSDVWFLEPQTAYSVHFSTS